MSEEQKQKEFQPRFFNPSEQDVDEALWCVRTNEPWTCAHDPECRDVFYAEVLRSREEISSLRQQLEQKEKDRQYHMGQINRLAEAHGIIGETSEAVVNKALTYPMRAIVDLAAKDAKIKELYSLRDLERDNAEKLVARIKALEAEIAERDEERWCKNPGSCESTTNLRNEYKLRAEKAEKALEEFHDKYLRREADHIEELREAVCRTNEANHPGYCLSGCLLCRAEDAEAQANDLAKKLGESEYQRGVLQATVAVFNAWMKNAKEGLGLTWQTHEGDCYCIACESYRSFPDILAPKPDAEAK